MSKSRHFVVTVFAAIWVVVAGCSSHTDSPAGTRGIAVAQKQAAPKRLALIIGNGRYGSSPLANPTNDAELIYRTLRDVGFEAKLYTNRTQREMKAAIREFGEALQAAAPNAVGVFYYAGHGVQVNGRNYLIPVGATIDSDADVDIEAVSADAVLAQMRESRNRLNFLILDACRNNPFARSSRSATRGLAQMDAPAGVMIAYSTAPGDVAADGDGRNSPYSQALARAMRGSSMPAELMFKEARDEVIRVTGERQTPWESSSLTGQNFYFDDHAPDSRLAVAAPTSTTPSTAEARPVVDRREADPPASREREPMIRPSEESRTRVASVTAQPSSSPRPATSQGGRVDTATAARAGRKVGGVLAGFGKGMFDATKEVVKPGGRLRLPAPCVAGSRGDCDPVRN